MRNKLVTLNSDRPHEGPCTAFDDEYLYISAMAAHQTCEDLKNAAKKAITGMSTYTVVELKTILEITCHPKAENLFFRYEKAGKRKKCMFEISDPEVRLAFCKELASASGLKTKAEVNDPYSRVGRDAIPILMIALITLGCCIGAFGMFTDPRSAKSQLFSDALEAVGPTAFLVIGLSFMGFFAYRMIKNIKASDSKIVYSP